jgi:hypothetical protein
MMDAAINPSSNMAETVVETTRAACAVSPKRSAGFVSKSAP